MPKAEQSPEVSIFVVADEQDRNTARDNRNKVAGASFTHYPG